jgi:hypothetical protein
LHKQQRQQRRRRRRQRRIDGRARGSSNGSVAAFAALSVSGVGGGFAGVRAGIAALLRNAQYMLLVIGLTSLFFVASGITFWGSDYMIVRLHGPPKLVMAVFGKSRVVLYDASPVVICQDTHTRIVSLTSTFFSALSVAIIFVYATHFFRHRSLTIIFFYAFLFAAQLLFSNHHFLLCLSLLLHSYFVIDGARVRCLFRRVVDRSTRRL